MTLKTGEVLADPRLDRLVQFDERSRNYPIRTLLPPYATSSLRSYTWTLTTTLNQGSEGRCVEYSICHELLARPVAVDIIKVQDILTTKSIYWPAQRNDQWPGGSYPGADPVYEGTSVLAGIKQAATLGFYTAYDWAFGIKELVAALGYHGPAVLGINWYDNMYTPDMYGWVNVGGALAGGHAILARGVRFAYAGRGRTWGDVDMDKSYVLLNNSWGYGWGLNGCAKVSFTDVDRLLKEDGECCLPRTRVK